MVMIEYEMNDVRIDIVRWCIPRAIDKLLRFLNSYLGYFTEYYSYVGFIFSLVISY